jgi:hypothetical protein
MNIINHLVALGTIAAIAFAFLINARSKRNKPGIEDLWTAEGYYNYLLAVIKASNTMLELEVAWEMVDNTWFTKTFRFPMNRFARKRKYIELVDAYLKMETLLTKVKVELCKN